MVEENRSSEFENTPEALSRPRRENGRAPADDQAAAEQVNGAVPAARRRRRPAAAHANAVASDAAPTAEGPVTETASGGAEAPKPRRRRPRASAPGEAASLPPTEAAPLEEPSAVELEAPIPPRRRRPTAKPAGSPKGQQSGPAVAEASVGTPDGEASAAPASGEAQLPAEGEQAPHRKRRRRGHRGGARRRQTAEQAVAGIPPVPEEPEPLSLEAVEEDREEEEEAEEAEAGEDLDTRVEHGRRRRGHGRDRGRRNRPKTAAELAIGPDHSEDVSFMHPSEREFAHLLEYYGINYLYEPRSFPLRWEGERVVQMFTPDFYLPEYDQYFELTTMKQSLVTQKNRKLRQVRELYPEINIQLLYRRDLMRLMGKYGFGPLAEVSVEGTERVLFAEEQVQQRVKELGEQITGDYKGREPVLIGVLRGVVVFMADLMRHIDLPMQIEFMEISHYGEEREDSIEVIRDAGTDVLGRDVILVEDIVDTGLTLRYLLEHLKEKKPNSVKVCTLLDKSVRRMADVPIDYVGFEVPDEFVIGYGLDYGGRYRNLRYIGVLQPAEPKAVAQR